MEHKNADYDLDDDAQLCAVKVSTNKTGRGKMWTENTSNFLQIKQFTSKQLQMQIVIPCKFFLFISWLCYTFRQLWISTLLIFPP